jgi:hypothetical protein
MHEDDRKQGREALDLAQELSDLCDGLEMALVSTAISRFLAAWLRNGPEEKRVAMLALMFEQVMSTCDEMEELEKRRATQ